MQQHTPRAATGIAGTMGFHTSGPWAKKLACIGILLGSLCAAVAQGATPTKIHFEHHASTEEGKKYALFTVQCSNGEAHTITAWDNRRDWCVSSRSRVACHRWQLAAARHACNDQ